MRPLQMVDTKTQYHKIKAEVDAAVIGVMESSQFIGGKPVADFANNLAAYNGSKHVIPCANGTDALQIAMMALGLQPGDEVITPSFTYIATVEVAALLRIKPVFVEVDKKTFCIDPVAIEKAITPKTKAIVPVHLYGLAVEMEPLLALSEKYSIPVIEDNAQGIGGSYLYPDGTKKKTGTLGIIGCTSFFPSKNLGGYGDGGAMFTNDDALAGKLRMIANHGQQVRYYHDMIGVNSRLDTLQAAVLRVKLPLLDEYIAARRKAAAYYDKAFANHERITIPQQAAYSHHVFHQYTLQIDGDRDGLVKYLQEKGIPSMIYYPVPCHLQKAFDGKGKVSSEMKNTMQLIDRVISLPMHTELDEEQLGYITTAVLQFL